LLLRIFPSRFDQVPSSAVCSTLLEQLDHKSGPPSLMGGTQAGACVPVEVFMEEHQIAPMWIGPKLFNPTMYRSVERPTVEGQTLCLVRVRIYCRIVFGARVVMTIPTNVASFIRRDLSVSRTICPF
jgi:hypothetical protein